VVASRPRVAFIGSKRIGLRCLTAMHATGSSDIVNIITFDDRSDSRHVFQELHCFGEQHRIPVTVTRGSADLHAAVRAAEPELAIVCGWYSMIGADTRAVARRGFIGVHNSLLPRYRGAAPLVWAMLHGEREVGLSMYTLTSGMDDGDIWAQTSTPLGPDDYIGDVLGRLEDACDQMIRDMYPRILENNVKPVPQDAAKATYGTLRSRDHGRIQWHEPMDRIYGWIRAQSKPYPGAFTSCDVRRLTIWRAHPFASPYYGRPGEVVKGPSGEMMVICGDDRALVIDAMQFDDGPMDAVWDSVRPRTVLGGEGQ
jgi:methionyl-tRNA formyltransferase